MNESTLNKTIVNTDKNKLIDYLRDQSKLSERWMTFILTAGLIIIGIFIQQIFVVIDNYIITSNENIDISFLDLFRILSLIVIVSVLTVISIMIFKYYNRKRKRIRKIIEKMFLIGSDQKIYINKIFNDVNKESSRKGFWIWLSGKIMLWEKD